MKANVPKAPKAWESLPPAQRKIIEDYAIKIAIEAARKQEENDCRVILDIYMKFTCLILHDAFGFGESRLNQFIGNHKRLFAQQTRLVSKGEQLEYLNKRMAEMFPKNGFPQEYIDGLLGVIELVDTQKEGCNNEVRK